MRTGVERHIWRSACAAVRRYFRAVPVADGATARAIQITSQAHFRTGYIIGYRNGQRLKSVKGVVREFYPARVWSEKDMMGTVHIKRQHEDGEVFDFIQIQYNYAHTNNAHQSQLADAILKLLA